MTRHPLYQAARDRESEMMGLIHAAGLERLARHKTRGLPESIMKAQDAFLGATAAWLDYLDYMATHR